ncbi:translocation/assembly module TamB [Mesorhizobium sp. L-8-10]|uniref:translocation/assembly module TamB domain-containing protein n=1 Tax=Mesorhizobium sp. L-8-10 TaxID=2744523 RepID=UPI001929379C|nr:translocation/assembly module TamB domain-containing protein [Mesorhizobium sp. L-8-10]BCH31741.1 translocation/assembly module TamB [Mesorhizobium sp. L-8-10]
MTVLRRMLRILSYVFLAVLALAVGAVAALTLTAKGRENLAALVSTMASTDDMKVRIGGIGGIWSGDLRVEHVVIEDAEGPWLVIRGAEIDWSPLALISWTFNAERIFAQRLEVARLPRSQNKGGGGGGGGLPVSVAIDNIDLPDIALGEEIAGAVAQLSAEGSLQALADPLNIGTELRVKRIDGVGGDLDASIHFVPSEQRLSVAIRGSEPAGGIIANLLQLPGAPPVQILVSGSGPIDDWSGSGTFSVDGAVVTTLSGSRQAVEGGNRIAVRGDGQFERFLPQSLRPLLSGKADFDISGLLGTTGRIEVERADLQSAAIRASAKGTIDPQGASDFALTVAGPVALDFGAASVALSNASVRVLGPGDKPNVDVTASLERLAAQGMELRNIEAVIHSDGFDVARRSGPVAVDLSAGSAVSDIPALAPLLAGQLKANLTAELSETAIGAIAGTLANDVVASRFSGEISRPDFALSIALAADVAASALPPPARPALGERVALSATVKRDAAGDLSVEALQLNSGGLAMGGNASLAGNTVDAALKGSLADIAPLADRATGAVEFSMTAKGDRNAPDVALGLTSDKIAAAGREITGLDITASGKVDLANPTADVALKGDFAGQTLNATATIRTTDGRRSVDGLTLALGDARLSGNLLLGDDFLPEGTLDLTVPDVGTLAALAGEEAKGEIQGKIRFARNDGVPEIVLETASPSLSRADLVAEGVALGATVSDYLAEPAISGRLRAGSVVSGSVAAHDVAATAGLSGDRLDLTLRATAPEGGTIAKALMLAGSPVFDITVSGSGPVADWQGEGTVAIDGAPVTGLSAHHALADGGRRITVKGDGQFERFAPDVVRPLLAGRTDFDIAALLAAAGSVNIEHATIQSPAVHVTAAGSLNPEGANDLAVQAEAVAGPVPLAFGTGEQAASVSLSAANIRIFGPGKQPMLDVEASLDRVAVQGNELRDIEATLHSDGFDVTTASGPLAADVTIGSATPAGAALAPLVAGQLKLAAEAQLSETAITIGSASLTGQALTARAAGTVSRPDFALALNIEADAAASALPAAAAPALGERVTLTATVKRDAAGMLTADPVKLVSGDLAVDGNAILAADNIEAALKGVFSNVGQVAEGTAGDIAFSVNARGRPNAPDLSLTVTSDRIQAAGREITGLELTASGAADFANPSANVSLKGNVAGQPLNGSAVLKTTEGRREVGGLSLVLGQNRITGDLVLDDAFVPEGAVDVLIPDVGPLAALAFEEAKGDIKGRIRFLRAGGVPEIVVDLTTAALSRGDLSAKAVSVEATVTDYLAAPAVSGRVRAGTIVSGGTSVGNADVTLTRDGVWTGFSGGATVNAMPAKAAGRFKIQNGETVIELASGEATVNSMKIGLAKAATVVIKSGETTLDRLALAVAGGNVIVSGSVGQALALDVQLAGLPAAAANTFSPGLNAIGTISGTARVSGQTSRPEVGYSLRWVNAGTAQTSAAGLGPLSVTSTGTFAGSALKFEADIGEASGLAIKGGGTVGTAGTPSLSLDFSGRVPFAILSRRLSPLGMSLSGDADVDLQIRGPATSPAISGTVRASGGRFVDSASGIAVNNLAADVSLGSGVATLRSLTGNISTGGTLSARGTVGIDPARGFPADLSLRIVDARYTDGRIVTTTVNGDLALKGSLVGTPVVSGTIDLGRTVITVPQRLPASLSTLDVQHRYAPKAVIQQQRAIQPAQASGTGGTGRIALDLTINAPQQIFVQGRGVDAELGGSLRLTGFSDAPQAVGQFEMRRGRLSILARRLNFTRGNLGFAGSLIPTLDMAADSDTGDATVTVTVTGPATDPEFGFSSVPALPQDEVLARLIFGRSMSHLSPLQIAQLAEAAAQLAGVGGPTSLLENLRGRLGVDDLDLKTDAQGNTAVSAGKYLNDRTYLTLEKGDKAGSGKAAIDLDVGRGIRLRGEASETGAAKGGIFFEREY